MVINFGDVDKAEATTFVNNTKISINPWDRCVDGRYFGDRLGGIAKPGATAGDVMIAFALLNRLGFSPEPEKVLNAVIKSVGTVENFHFHTDTHADPQVPGLGCGHLKQAQQDPEAYGLTAGQMDFLFSALPRLLQQGAQQAVLQGKHEEQAVISVDSHNYSLKPQLSASGQVQQVFVYQRTLARQSLTQLATHLGSIINLAEQQVLSAALEVSAAHLGQTLQRLAPNLPVYTAAINSDGQVTVG